MIRAAIADDEVLARQKLRTLLGREPDVSVVGEGANGLETIQLVQEARPDLLFLDIRMPEMDGFEIMEALSEDGMHPLPTIIFTTAYDAYAIRAFDISAIDYLLKPFTAERLHAAIEKVKGRQHSPESNSFVRAEDQLNVPSSRFISRIVFKSRGRILFLSVRDVYCIGAEENYVRLCTDSETHLLRETMNRIEERLDPEKFMRVHRSHIVNLEFLKEVRTEKTGEMVVLLTNGQKIPMSRGCRARLHALLER
jgi:two-component system, LytTR family, response regulator